MVCPKRAEDIQALSPQAICPETARKKIHEGPAHGAQPRFRIENTLGRRSGARGLGVPRGVASRAVLRSGVLDALLDFGTVRLDRCVRGDPVTASEPFLGV